MGAYGVALESEITFRGKAERTARIYHYRIAAPVTTDYDNLLEAVLAEDKLAHPSGHAYKLGRVWGPTEGTEADNQMRHVKDLNTTGVASYTVTDLYPELAYVVSRFIGRSPVKRRKLFLRKFIRPGKLKDGGDNAATGTVSPGSQAFFNGWFNGMATVTHNAISFAQCSPNDHPIDTNHLSSTLPFLHVRQLKQ